MRQYLRLFLVEILVEADQFLAAADDAPHHPVERAALQEFIDPLGHVAGIDPVRRARTLASLLSSGRLKLLHVGKVIDADRQLDQMQHHGPAVIPSLCHDRIGIFRR